MGITKQTQEKIKALYADGHTCSEIAKMLNIPESIIKHICTN